MNGEQRIKQKNADNNSFEAVLQLVEQRYWHQNIQLEEVGVCCGYSRPLPEEKQCSLFSFFPKQNHSENWNPTFRGHLYLQFLLTLMETAQTTKIPQTVPDGAKQEVCLL